MSNLLRSLALPPACLAAGCLLLLTATPARAVAVQRHEIVGVVTVINQTDRTFVVQPDPPAALMTLHWDRSTEFFANDNRAKADALPVRLRIHVRYVVPFFGKPEAMRVFWHTAPVAGHAGVLTWLTARPSQSIRVADIHVRPQSGKVLFWTGVMRRSQPRQRGART